MTPRPYVSIVSGLPRSGTSMMMRMLAVGGLEPLTDGVRSADPDNPLGYYEFELVKNTREDSSWVALAIGKAVKAIHLFLEDLPLDRRYRVVLMRRNLDEVLRSQQLMLQRLGKPSAGLPPERMAAIFTAQLERARQHLLRHSDSFRLLEVDYNLMLRDPGPAVEAVSRFLDGLDEQKMLAVVDPRLYRQRSTG